MAGRGRVDDDQVGRLAPLELLDLAEHEDVLDAGRGGGHHVDGARLDSSRFEIRRMPWSSRYSTRASSGVSVRARTPSATTRLVVVERCRPSEGGAEAALALDLDDQGLADRRRAAIRASAALTVVLPTPPFPATMITRAWAQNRAGSTSCADYSPSCWLLGALLIGAPRGGDGQDRGRHADPGRRHPRPDHGRLHRRHHCGRPAVAVVIQINSTRGVLERERARSARTVDARSKQAGVWIGPARAGRARGQAADCFGSRRSGLSHRAPRSRGGVRGRHEPGTDAGRLPGRRHERALQGHPSQTGDPPQRQPTVPIRFAKPPMVDRLLHASANPSVPYFLLVIGMLLILFEFFTVGHRPGGGDRTARPRSCRPTASACCPPVRRPSRLLVLGMVGLSIDLQAGAPRAWTVIGAGGLVAGSLTLYAGMTVPLDRGRIGAGRARRCSWARPCLR